MFGKCAQKLEDQYNSLALTVINYLFLSWLIELNYQLSIPKFSVFCSFLQGSLFVPLTRSFAVQFQSLYLDSAPALVILMGTV